MADLDNKTLGAMMASTTIVGALIDALVAKGVFSRTEANSIFANALDALDPSVKNTPVGVEAVIYLTRFVQLFAPKN